MECCSTEGSVDISEVTGKLIHIKYCGYHSSEAVYSDILNAYIPRSYGIG